MQKQNATPATEQELLTQRIQYTDNSINQHVSPLPVLLRATFATVKAQ